MSIRIRHVEGVGLIAICAARSVEKPGDIYLDDAAHSALSVKFALDYASMGFLVKRVAGLHADSPSAAAMEVEESNNPNREWWDSVYGATATGPKCSINRCRNPATKRWVAGKHTGRGKMTLSRCDDHPPPPYYVLGAVLDATPTPSAVEPPLAAPPSDSPTTHPDD